MPFDPISYLEALKSRKLSNLIVDADKDWRGYIIKNLGEPTEPNDAARKIYVDVAATGLGINYFLLDEADSEVTAYKAMSFNVPELSEAYVEASHNTAGEYEIASWIAPLNGIPLKLGVYELHCQAEIVSGNIDVRLFFRLYERQSGGSEVLIAESMLSDKIDSRRDVIISLILASDYVMSAGSRLVVKLFAKYESGGSHTTVRVYYQGDVRSRLACPIAKEILDTVYAAKVHTHSPSDITPQGSGSGLDADTLDGLHASDILAQAGGGKALVAADESEVSTTSTSNVSMKQFNLVKLSSVGNDWNTLTVIAEGYVDTSGETATLDVYVGGNLEGTITWTETSYTIKYVQIDVSGLADGKYLVDLQMRVSGGTGYLQLVEAWVE